jgi:hypothetical protein
MVKANYRYGCLVRVVVLMAKLARNSNIIYFAKIISIYLSSKLYLMKVYAYSCMQIKYNDNNIPRTA